MMSQISLLIKRSIIVFGVVIGLFFLIIELWHASSRPSFFHTCSNVSEKEEFFDERCLNQPFFYLAKGAQSVAFLSKDEKYVIKFFQKKCLDPSSIFKAYELAYTVFREESGLLMIHFAKTPYLKKELDIRGKWGFKYRVDLRNTSFVIQEKAELIFDRMERLKKEGRQEELFQAKQRVLDLVKRRIAKNLTDDDRAVSHNYGFVKDRAVQLDIGRVHIGKREKEFEQIEEKITKRMSF